MPDRVIELRDEDSGLDAFVVVDNSLFPESAGGTRLAPDVSVEEVARLARAMTWKFASCRVPLSGAKAGIRFAGGDRAAVMEAYRRKLEPLRGVFSTGPDLGTSPDDFVEDHGREIPLWARSHEGLGMDDLATGYGVKAAAAAALEHLGRGFEGARVAIEGFGKVGAGTARACGRAGALVVGVSTVHGLAADPEGLDVEALIALRAKHGDRLVEHAGGGSRPREELFDLDCDVVVPGARPDAVSRDVARRLRSAVVSPGANVPYGEGALDVLHEREILALPDFVANAGGVHLYESVEGLDSPAALDRIEELIGAATRRILAEAADRGVAPMAAALADARRWLAEQFPGERETIASLFPPA